MVRSYVSTVLTIGCFWKSRSPQTGEHMVEVKRIKTPGDIPAEGSYVLVLYGPSAMDREHPRGRTLMVRAGKRDKVKLDDFAAAVEIAKTSRKPNSSRPSTWSMKPTPPRRPPG